jgi:hypothetical protein
MDIATVVGSVSGDAAKDNRTRQSGRCVTTGVGNDRQSCHPGTAEGNPPDGDRTGSADDSYDRKVFLAVSGEVYKPAIRFVIATAYRADLDGRALQLWWDGMSDQMIKARLHGWLMWTQFCQERDMTVEGLAENVHAA